MSEKARRSRAWDDQNLKGPLLWPAKQLLRAFSSITLAVVLLVAIAVYGATASIPVGLIVLGLTYAIYGMTILATLAVLAGLPAWLLRRALRASRTSGKRSPREFVLPFLALLALTPLAAFLWYRFAWPVLHYDPATGTGLKLFADFVYQYKSVTIRRLPGVEMSELEYYSWWPLRVILLLFVVNMVVATVRRIDFNFKNIGVLTVHTGIVTLALGSIYYSGLKLEGDTLLLAGPVDPEKGLPTVGPAQDIFYDNTDVSLWVSQDRGWEQRQLSGVPRYNNYNLSAISGESAWEASRRHAPWLHQDEQASDDAHHTHAPPRTLAISVPHKADQGGAALVDSDLRFRVVGYCFYAQAVTDWIKPSSTHIAPAVSDQPDNPLRLVFLHSGLPDEKGVVSEAEPVFAYTLLPAIPAQRLSTRFDAEQPVLSVEYTTANAGPAATSAPSMSAQRWQDLSEPLPEGTTHALVIEVPAADGTSARTVAPVSIGQSITLAGFAVRLDELHAKPPFPIITKGYEKATSAVAVVTITPPPAINDGKPFTRYVYSRFAEINQDILGAKDDGRPIRGSANPAIRVGFIEADHLALYFDEPQGANGPIRAIVRQPGGNVRVIDDLATTDQGPAPTSPGSEGIWLRNAVDKLSFRVGARWPNAVQIDRPSPVPSIDQNKEDVGTHGKSMLAVELTSTSPNLQGWKQVTWLPFSRYMGMGLGNERSVDLPDGRFVTLAFGRTAHRFPTFALQLVDFEMIAYDHRGAPRDYQSVVRVSPITDIGARPDFEPYQHVTKLNEPLMAPFNFSEDRSLVANLFGRLASGLSPHQFKLSQAGWDQSGWNQTQAQADAGQLPRPFAKFTILGVGNNPGIHVIALGGILMGLGIPWAFYVKPWLVQREKKRLQELARARLTIPNSPPQSAPKPTPA